MARIVNRDFYAPWPLFGTKLSQQWGEIRVNQESLRPLVKATEVDGDDDNLLTTKLAAIKFGEEDFQNKARIDWHKETQELHFQCNTNTEATPIWRSLFYLDCTENKTFFLDSVAGPGVLTDGENIGTGTADVFKQRSGDKLQFRTLEGGSGISVVQGSEEITITNTGGSGSAITVKDTEGAKLFSTNVITFHRNDFYLTPDSNGDPVINALASGGGGGGGTLTQIVITDGVETLSSSEGKFHLSGADFYLTKAADNNPQINAISRKPDVTEIGGTRTIEEVDVLGFNRSDFYITETTGGQPVVNLNEAFLGDSSIKTGARSASFTGFEWEFTHNFASDIVLWDIIDDAGESIIPEKADFSNQNVAHFYFLESITGTAILSTGRVTGEITAAHTDNTQNLSGINKITVNVDSFYLTQGTSSEEAIINFRGAIDSENNTASNLGSGEGVFAQKVASDLQFKSLVAGQEMEFSSDANEITLKSISGPGFYGVTVKEDSTVIARTDSLQFEADDFDLSTQDGDVRIVLSSDVAKQSDIGPGFYGINVKQTDDLASFSNINTVAFHTNDFYITQNDPNTDEVVVNLRGTAAAAGGITSINVSTSNNSEDQYQSDTLIFNRESFYVSTSPSGKPVVNFLPEFDEKSITVRGPSRRETITWWVPARDITIERITAFLRADDSGFYPWVDWTMRHGGCPPARGTGTEVITGGTRTGFYPGHPLLVNPCDIITTFDSPDIGANSFVWFETTNLGEGRLEEEIHVTAHFSNKDVI
jgi:hypothetical protein